MVSRMKIRRHWEMTRRALLGMMMPILSMLMRAFMMSQGDPEEEVNTLEDTVAAPQELVAEKKMI